MTPQTTIVSCHDGDEIKVVLTPYPLDVCITFEDTTWGFTKKFWYDLGNPQRIEEAYENLCAIAYHIASVRSNDSVTS